MNPLASDLGEQEDRSGRPWFDHVGIAVHELGGPVDLIQRGLGGEFMRGGDNANYGFRTAQFRLRGGVKLELLAPLAGQAGTDLAKFLDIRGPGVHHITLISDDIATLDGHLRACGYATTDHDLVDPNWQEVYLGPRQGLGTIVQLAETVLDWGHAEPGANLEAVFDGLWRWENARTVRGSDRDSHSTDG